MPDRHLGCAGAGIHPRATLGERIGGRISDAIGRRDGEGGRPTSR